MNDDDDTIESLDDLDDIEEIAGFDIDEPGFATAPERSWPGIVPDSLRQLWPEFSHRERVLVAVMADGFILSLEPGN
jgi:hypothetical protein